MRCAFCYYGNSEIICIALVLTRSRRALNFYGRSSALRAPCVPPPCRMQTSRGIRQKERVAGVAAALSGLRLSPFAFDFVDKLLEDIGLMHHLVDSLRRFVHGVGGIPRYGCKVLDGTVDFIRGSRLLFSG